MTASPTPQDIKETRNAFIVALRTLARDPNPLLAAVRIKGCDADFLRDIVANDHYEQTPTGTPPLTHSNFNAAFGAYGGTLAGLAVASSNTPTSDIDDMLDNHSYELHDQVLFMATDTLGMTPPQANDLFLEHVASPDVEDALISGEVTYQHAASVFANYLETGKVDWDAVL